MPQLVQPARLTPICSVFFAASVFMQAQAFINSITPENAFTATAAGNTRAGQAAFGMAHFMDHYGKLVEYLRMNGIVPPASR